MLASQGPTFVGSWPYRQILIRIFNEVEEKKDDLKELIKDIFYYCLHNSSDFLLAGYSHQVTLCDLRQIPELTVSMEKLSNALVNALTDDPTNPKDEVDAASKYVILYAHWKAQSFFQEMYTDLYDFCQCIIDRCKRLREAEDHVTPQLAEIDLACREVKAKLEKTGLPSSSGAEQTSKKDSIIFQSEFAGPAFQYSHGLSVYFPWTEPLDDSHILQQYREYKFTQEFKTSWLDFLKLYFDHTRRFTRKDELAERGETTELTDAQALQEDILSLIYNGEGPLGGYALKTDPNDKQGGDCDCISFKNYARDTRARGERRKRAQKMPGRSLIGRVDVI